MISTREVSELPSHDALKKLTQALAILDAIVEPEWEYRYYSFNAKWSDTEQMASLRNGQGDSWFCVFGPPGVFLKGFDHESKMSPWNQDPSAVWPGVLESVPPEFELCLTEPAFSMKDTTFCIWRRAGGSRWETGKITFPEAEDPDGSGWMLAILDGKPATYKEWAEGYYEMSLSIAAIEKIYQGEPLTPELAHELNPDADYSCVLSDAAEIGYPVA